MSSGVLSASSVERAAAACCSPGVRQPLRRRITYVSTGLRNAAIAERLFLSPRTVDHHVSGILRKLEADSRGEAVARGMQLGLVQNGQAAATT